MSPANSITNTCGLTLSLISYRVISLCRLISKRGRKNTHYCTFHKNETKVLIDQNDQSRINNLNPHHSQRGVIAAET